MVPPIQSDRLLLVSLGIAALELLLANDRSGAGKLLNCVIPPDLSLEDMPLARRLHQLRDDPSVQPWLVRAMVHRETKTLIGHIGFHTAPRADYLAAVVADGVELGYTVHPSHRRRGYATEAIIAMMRWAFVTHGQKSFVLSISPKNLPSTKLAESLGFKPVSSHIDEEDGLEIIFSRRFKKEPAENISPT